MQQAEKIYNIENINNAVFNILGKSMEYKELIEKVNELKEDLLDIVDVQRRLKKSQKLNEAKNQLEQFKKDVIRLAETFSNVEINTERLGIAKEHFENGHFREADAILKAEDLSNDQDTLLKRKKNLEKEQIKVTNQLQQNSDEWLIKAKLTSLNYVLTNRIYLARTYFEKALLSSKNFDNLFDYADFLMVNKQYKDAYSLMSEAETLYKKEEQKMESDSYKLKKVKMLNIKGFLQVSLEKYEEAETSYKLALDLGQQLLKTIPDNNKVLILTSINNLSSLTLQNKKDLDARIYTDEAMKIYEGIKDPTIEVKFEYGRTLRIAANASRNKQVGGGLCRKGFKLYQELSDADPDKYLDSLIKSLTDLAMFSFEPKESEDSFLEAIKIAREQSQRNPDVYFPLLSHCLYLYGAFLNNKFKRYSEAKQIAEESLQICEVLFANNPETYLPSLARIQKNLAVAFDVVGEIDNAIEYYRKSYNNYKLLREKNPKMYFEESLEAINYLGTFQFLKKRYNDAEQSFLELQSDLSSLVDFGKTKFYFGLVENFYMLSKMFKDDTPNMKKSLFYANKTMLLLENPITSTDNFIDIQKKTSAIITFWKTSDTA